jgi:hypothetical protein
MQKVTVCLQKKLDTLALDKYVLNKLQQEKFKHVIDIPADNNSNDNKQNDLIHFSHEVLSKKFPDFYLEEIKNPSPWKKGNSSAPPPPNPRPPVEGEYTPLHPSQEGKFHSLPLEGGGLGWG